MANNRTATLAALAQQALDQYRTDIASGEPVFPQWALDLQQVLEERQQIIDSLCSMLLEHDAGGITMATSREARALIAEIHKTEEPT